MERRITGINGRTDSRLLKLTKLLGVSKLTNFEAAASVGFIASIMLATRKFAKALSVSGVVMKSIESGSIKNYYSYDSR